MRGVHAAPEAARRALPRAGGAGRPRAGHVQRRTRPGGSADSARRTGVRGCGHDGNREHPDPCPPRRCSGARAASGAHHQAVIDVAAAGRPEGGPGQHTGGRPRPVLRERAAGGRRRRGREGAGVLRRRPGPGRARQVPATPGGLDAARGEARSAEAVRPRQGRRPAARAHRGRHGALRRLPVALTDEERLTGRLPEGHKVIKQLAPRGTEADQARIRALGQRIYRPAQVRSATASSCAFLLARTRLPPLGRGRAAPAGRTRPRARRIRVPADDAARLHRRHGPGADDRAAPRDPRVRTRRDGQAALRAQPRLAGQGPGGPGAVRGPRRPSAAQGPAALPRARPWRRSCSRRRTTGRGR